VLPAGSRLRVWPNKLRRRLGGSYYYALGQRAFRVGQFEKALQLFRDSEAWVVALHGQVHPHRVGAILRQAACLARLDRQAEACELYDRALDIVRELGAGDTAMGKEIRDYLRDACG